MSVSDRGGRSFADQLFVDGEIDYGGFDHITEGPLAGFSPGFDPISHAETMRKRAQSEIDKVARVVGESTAFDSPAGPGADRVVQGTPDPNAYNADPQQTPDHALAQKPQAQEDKKKGAPDKGVSGSLLDKIKGRIEKNVETKGVNGTADSESNTDAKGLTLMVRDPAPIPKELKPNNLADYDQKSAWTGSGPNAALHEEHSKVGELEALLPFADQSLLAPDLEKEAEAEDVVNDEDVDVRLAFAGVPVHLAGDAVREAASWSMSKSAGDEEYLARDDIHPLKLLATLDDSLGMEWREWEPETISQTLEKEAGVEIPETVMNKVMAVKIALRRPDVFFDDWMAMEKMAVSLNDAAPVMGAVEDMPIEWLSNAVAIMTKIAGRHEFSPEVKTYVAARLYDSGYVVAPPLLRFADDVLGEKVADDGMRKKVILAYAENLGAREPIDGEDAVSIQVARLMRNHSYVLDKLEESQAQVGM